jgi:hypothetical protein
VEVMFKGVPEGTGSGYDDHDGVRGDVVFLAMGVTLVFYGRGDIRV